MTGIRVAVRADASRTLGSGHVVRCLTLATVLRARGATVQFICRPELGHLGAHIAGLGFGLHWLPDKPDWPDWSVASDAHDTRAALGPAGCDLLLVDHYALGAAWHAALRPACRRIAVIDDLADRAHETDLLLDQNLGRRADDYAALLPPGAIRLIGPHYALLRPEFASARNASLARRAGGRLQQLLVSMGGADPQQATLRVLQAMAGGPLPAGVQVTVVLGAIAETRPAIAALLPTLPWPARLCVDVAEMAPLLQAADLAIGAAGGSAWERCCLGLPSLLLVLAGNQQAGTRALVTAGAALAVGTVAELSATLPAALHHAADPGTLQRLSSAAAGIADGLGAQRVADALLASLCA